MTLVEAALLAAVAVVLVVRAATTAEHATRHDPLGIDLGTTHYQRVVDSMDPTGAGAGGNCVGAQMNCVGDGGGMTLQELAELQ